MLGRFLIRAAVLIVLIAMASCASALTPRQEITWDAYKACQMEGPATRLEHLTVDGGWEVAGRGVELQRVHTCMQAYWRRAVLEGRTPAMPASVAIEAPSGPGA